MINNGLSFVPATGRTRDNAIGAISPLSITLPIICDNGTFIYDTIKEKFIKKKTIKDDVAVKAIDIIIQHNVTPLINTLEKNIITIYHSNLKTVAQRDYFEGRNSYGLSRYIEDHTYLKYKQTNVFNISMIDTHENLIDLYNILVKDEDLTVEMFPAHYYPEHFWLEILPPNSGKGQSVDYLSKLYKPDKIVCFGDNLNDLCMFERADIKVATENALDEVKDIADIVIGHCDDNSVVKYIYEDAVKIMK